MYLHIGNDNIIKKNEIIGIFNYEKLKEDKIFKKFLEKIELKEKIKNISEGNEKTIIIVKNEKIKAYITNISSATLLKRNTLEKI
ncbi:MAG: DUF370 domain-containing protein [Clostridia bacterium]|jgi:hypothetical protein|nr:DUF370 domain-containing protein [Clostridia bacterium]